MKLYYFDFVHDGQAVFDDEGILLVDLDEVAFEAIRSLCDLSHEELRQRRIQI